MEGEWEKPQAIKAVHRKASELPHLVPLLVVFFKGALETQEDFDTEFKVGGQIDLATSWRKDLAPMPPTNDANEGALGAHC